MWPFCINRRIMEIKTMFKKIRVIITMVIVVLVGCKSNDEVEPNTEIEITTEKNYSADEDSDYDGLSDLEEVEDYKTDPEKEDTDGDGIDDLIEVNINTDPCEYNEMFPVKLTREEVTEYNLVSLEVDVELNKDQVLSADIEALTASDNFLLSPSLTGYLGNAYRFTLDGEADAVLTFRYNTDVYGLSNDEFLPCIYSFDEDTQLFTELECENTEDGALQTKVNKEGIYILLNKIEHDKLWGLNIGEWME